MTPRLRRLVVLGLIATGVWAFVLWWRSDGRRIDRQIGKLERLVARRPGEHRLTGLNKARQVAELFAAHFEVRAPRYGVVTDDRRTLIAAIERFRSRSERIAMSVAERELWIDDDLRRATVRMVISFTTGIGSTAGREAYRVEANLVEEAGEWRFDYVELLEVLEGPGRLW